MLSVTLVSILIATHAAEPDAALKPFQGKWVIHAADLAGKDHLDLFKGMTLTVTGENYVIDFKENSDKGTIKIDATKTPKQIDLKTSKEGPFKARNLPGIYEFKGDTIVICLNSEKQERPTKFAAPEKTPIMLLTFKRENK